MFENFLTIKKEKKKEFLSFHPVTGTYDNQKVMLKSICKISLLLGKYNREKTENKFTKIWTYYDDRVSDFSLFYFPNI